MNKADFLQLIDKYLAGQASKEDEQLLLNFFNSFQGETDWDEQALGVKQALEDKMLRHIQAAMHAPGRKPVLRMLPLRKVAAAAALLAITLTGAWYLTHQQTPRNPPVAARSVKQDFAPGGNKAVLILEDGSNVALDDAKNGLLAHSGQATIKKEKDGQLVYSKEGNTAPYTPTAYNIIKTPVGGQYQVVLPDGTTVWLNAASSLRYPTAFKGTERVVELSGEGYFEVAQNAAMPFTVKVNDAEVKVLGTHFNIMAYNDEPALRTTLLEGSVKLTRGTAASLLKPGQQGVIGADGGIKVQPVDVAQVVAWKNGYFDFNRSNIRDIMHQLSRWYDIDVIYNGSIPEDEYVGKISRNTKLSEVLRILQLSHVQFKVDERKIIVTP